MLYHCVDEHSAFPGHFMSPEVVKAYDDELTRRADLVITTSENLRESREGINPHTYTVLNAADVELFNQALDSRPPRAGGPGRRSRPLASGSWACTTTGWTWTLWKRWCKADPTWHVVLIGPAEGRATMNKPGSRLSERASAG